jgi:hypothetical protein
MDDNHTWIMATEELHVVDGVCVSYTFSALTRSVACYFKEKRLASQYKKNISHQVAREKRYDNFFAG